MDWTTIIGFTVSVVIFVGQMASTHKNGLIGSVVEFFNK